MKKLLAILAVIIVMIVAVSPLIALAAADVTNAEWKSKITVSNNGTAVEDVPGTFVLSTEGMIDADMLAANATDATMRTASGTDVPFMPSVNSTYPWCTWIPAIEASASLYQYLYSGNVVDGLVRYFPGAGGMSTLDDPQMELCEDFIVTQSGWVNTDNGSDKYLAHKPGAFGVYVSEDVSGNITASLMTLGDNTTVILYPNATGDYTNIASVTGAATHWEAVDDPEASPDDGTTLVSTMSLTYEKDAYNLEPLGLEGVAGVASVRVYFRGRKSAGVGKCKPYLRLGANETTGSEVEFADEFGSHSEVLARPGGGSWVVSDIEDLQVAIGIKNSAATTQVTQVYVKVTLQYSIPSTPAVTATGVESKKCAVTATTSGNLLHFDGTAQSRVSCGTLYSAAPKLAISFWFKPDSDFSAGGGTLDLFGQFSSGDNRHFIFLSQTDGKLHYLMKSGGITRFDILSTETTWDADVWYHVFAAMGQAAGGGAASDGARLRINNGAAVTSANTTALPGISQFNIGSQFSGDATAFIGYLANFAVFTDDVTAAEETALYNGTTPGDETDYWYIDEGTGTSITSYGSEANAGNAGGATSWGTGHIARWLGIEIDGTLEDSTRGNVVVPDNANNWAFCQNDSIIFLECQTVSINGTQVQYIDYEYDTTFHDSSGFDNDATPTFRTTSTADITAEVVAHDSLFETENPAVTPTEGWEMITENVTEPVGLYTEGGTDFPGSNLIIELAGYWRVPVEVISIPIALLSAMLAGLFAYGWTHSTKLGVRGSLWVQCMVTGGVMILWYVGGGGVLPGWILIPFGLWAIVMLLWRNPFNPAG